MLEEYILITTKGEIEVVQIESEQFLGKCYELIKCDCIEVCVPNYKNGNTALRFILYESGKINDQEYNLIATLEYNRPDILFGNVIIGKVGLNQYGEMDIVGLEYWEIDEISYHLDIASKSLGFVGLI